MKMTVERVAKIAGERTTIINFSWTCLQDLDEPRLNHTVVRSVTHYYENRKSARVHLELVQCSRWYDGVIYHPTLPVSATHYVAHTTC